MITLREIIISGFVKHYPTLKTEFHDPIEICRDDIELCPPYVVSIPPIRNVFTIYCVDGILF